MDKPFKKIIVCRNCGETKKVLKNKSVLFCSYKCNCQYRRKQFKKTFGFPYMGSKSIFSKPLADIIRYEVRVSYTGHISEVFQLISN